MTAQDTKLTANTTQRPRIYVASLSDYNAGRLLGRWIDADQSADAIHSEIAAMLEESKEEIAEEWAIHDYECFGELRLSEFDSIDLVAQAARLIVEHGKMFAGLLNHFGGLAGMDEAKQYMDEGYLGEFSSLADYAQELIDDLYSDLIRAIPEFIRYHIDYDGIAHDLELGGHIFTVVCNGMLHVFDAHI